MINYFSKDLDTVTDELVFKDGLDCFLKRIGSQLVFSIELDFNLVFSNNNGFKTNGFSKGSVFQDVKDIGRIFGLNKDLEGNFLRRRFKEKRFIVVLRSKIIGFSLIKKSKTAQS